MERPIRIDIARIARNKKKLCTCFNPHYEVDPINRLVECTDCGAIVDPFDAMYEISRHFERVNQQFDAMVKERESVIGYEPRLKVMKELSARYSGKNSPMVPRCPHCGNPFEIHDLLSTSWCSRCFLKPKGGAEGGN